MAHRLLAPVLAVLLVAGAALAAFDLQRVEKRTLVLYATPALKDLLEKDILPRYEAQTGQRVEPVYVAAGEQYNRLRMSGDRPEADLFVHASPLYIEKGHVDGYFEPFEIGRDWQKAYRSRELGGASFWYAFAWTPLVEVYSVRFERPPDLATSDASFGLAHPLLSNNGVYNVVLFETVDPEAGRHALGRTQVQPVNARSSINGVADGSFDLTLGYEAVTLLYQAKGANVVMDLPELRGNRTLLRVLLSVGLVSDHPHPDAERFARFLFTTETQARLAANHFRAIDPKFAPPAGGVDLDDAAAVAFDWSRWADVEAKLKDYEVRS